MISLEQFVAKYKGKRVNVPWGYAGQCVSLVQRYLNECLGYDLHPRGNAKDWVNTLQNEGIAKPVGKPAQAGDIIVYGSGYGGGYGHIAVALGNGKMFDQNNTSHDGGRAGVTNIFGNYTVMRPNKHTYPAPNKSRNYVNLPGTVSTWRVYPINKTPVKANSIGAIKPSNFGGLSYYVYEYRDNHATAVIHTQKYGKVKIYIKDTCAIITVGEYLYPRVHDKV